MTPGRRAPPSELRRPLPVPGCESVLARAVKLTANRLPLLSCDFPLGVSVGIVEGVRSLSRRSVAAYLPMIVLVVFGVLTMHSVAPTASADGHSGICAQEDLNHQTDPVAHGEHDCPSGHQMIHPCAGTVTWWPAVPMPAPAVGIDVRPIASDGAAGDVGSYLGRAPPWSLQGLDESVTLRV